MMKVDHHFIEKALGQSSLDSFFIEGMEHDSRKDLSGKLFVAIKGERADGHDFCQMAKEKGAAALLVDHAVPVDLPQIIVDNVILAMGQIAQAWLQQCNVKICAITGSAGKTSVKNMTASILKAAFGDKRVFSTPGNFNSDIGLPLALSQLSPAHDYAVLEMGMNRFGEIDYLSRLVRPDVACINNVLPVHTEGVGGIEGVLKAKSEIFHGLKNTGVAVMNRDIEFYEAICQATRAFQQITFGFSILADVRAESIEADARQTRFVLVRGDERHSITLPYPGEHYVMNALAATACASVFSVDLDAIAKGLSAAQFEKHRMAFVKGLNGVTIIDDCYNANVEAVLKNASVLLKQAGEQVLVLGDMGEIGQDPEGVHRNMGAALKKMGVKRLFCTGVLSAHTAEGFGEGATHYETKDALVDAVKAHCKANTHIMIKASRSRQFETIVEALL